MTEAEAIKQKERIKFKKVIPPISFSIWDSMQAELYLYMRCSSIHLILALFAELKDSARNFAKRSL